MDFVTVIIPTYNRLKDILQTLPEITKFLDSSSELIIFDQSNSYNPEDNIDKLKDLLLNVNSRYFHCDTPSLPLAWNTAASLAKGNIILFLDDDINIDSNIIEIHRNHYIKDPEIVGVAGSYYAASYERQWIPSSRNGSASTLAGVNASFRKDIFLKAGAASSFIPSFAPVDWEIAEHINDHFGRIAVGSDAFVFHRAPADGGCENQSERGVNWYYGCYHNHVLWMLHRQFPFNLLRLPRHFYALIKYCVPKKKLLLQSDFWKHGVKNAIKNAFKKYHQDKKQRRKDALPECTSFHCVLDTQNKN